MRKQHYGRCLCCCVNRCLDRTFTLRWRNPAKAQLQRFVVVAPRFNANFVVLARLQTHGYTGVTQAIVRGHERGLAYQTTVIGHDMFVIEEQPGHRAIGLQN